MNLVVFHSGRNKMIHLVHIQEQCLHGKCCTSWTLLGLPCAAHKVEGDQNGKYIHMVKTKIILDLEASTV